MAKRKVNLLIVCSLLFITGCWDQVAIEERGFVVGSSIDMGEEQQEENLNIKLTNQIVIPSGLGTPSTGSGEQKAYMNIAASGNSLFEISREMISQMSRAPYYEHLKIVVVSEEVAKESGVFPSIMDVFLREQQMRRSIKVIISEEEAAKILETDTKMEKLPAMYINEILENSVRTIETVAPVRMGEIHEFLLNKSSFVLPRALLKGKMMNDSGGAVFRGSDDKMIGTLTSDEVKGLNLIAHKTRDGIINFKVNDQLMIYDIQGTKSSIKIDVKDKDQVNISIIIEAKGGIGEVFGSQSLLTSERFKQIEEQINKKIEELATNTLEKAQEELNADIFGFNAILKQRHYDQWQKLKKDWDKEGNAFSNAKISVTAKAQVRMTGVTEKTKDKGIGE
ncbi:Ger(x)C family spore germination protein [Virgibacillus sp. DJP39]|uniref:Ger(x)C family spore germination protein n=1 Tax=Virgibacillus sp. DJP39 TaxID=3409790 RepID=UPI003BB76012